MSIIIAAAQLAAHYHKQQIRNYSGRPYLTHLIRVAGHYMTLTNATENSTAACFLHDSIEDQAPTSLDVARISAEIKQHCGERTLKLVLELTNQSKGMQLPRAERKRIDREHLQKASWEARRIKLVDRIDNVQETTRNINAHIVANLEFPNLYAEESQALLEVLKGTDTELENTLEQSIIDLRHACKALA